MTGSPFVGGRNDDGRLYLTRRDGSQARCAVVIIRGATLTDNGDSTVDVTFDGS